MKANENLYLIPYETTNKMRNLKHVVQNLRRANLSVKPQGGFER